MAVAPAPWRLPTVGWSDRMKQILRSPLPYFKVFQLLCVSPDNAENIGVEIRATDRYGQLAILGTIKPNRHKFLQVTSVWENAPENDVDCGPQGRCGQRNLGPGMADVE